MAKNVVKSVPLPLDGLVAAKDKNGNDVIVSTNGRYFQGIPAGCLTNKQIKTVDDAVDAQYLTLANMGLNLVDIGTIPYGNPKAAAAGADHG